MSVPDVGLWRCGPCAAENHASHNGTFRDGTKHEGEPCDHLDMYDCKTLHPNSSHVQCGCRATWPERFA